MDTFIHYCLSLATVSVNCLSSGRCGVVLAVRGAWWPAETYDAAWSVEFFEHVSGSIATHTHTHRERERERHKERDTETERQRQRQKKQHTNTDTHRETHRDRDRDRDRETLRETKRRAAISSLLLFSLNLSNEFELLVQCWPAVLVIVNEMFIVCN